jgi:hypothetical protein
LLWLRAGPILRSTHRFGDAEEDNHAIATALRRGCLIVVILLAVMRLVGLHDLLLDGIQV